MPITELEQSAFCQTGTSLRTKTLEQEFKAGVRWQKIPTRYMKLTPEEITDGIEELKVVLADYLVILGHHYQRTDVIKYADFRGDSYLLSVKASGMEDTQFIVFCGVHFMAETADILTSSEQTVILPNMAAGCSMADMAQAEDVNECWSDITNIFGNDDTVVPVTYMISAADIKALCGRNNGIVCTSSNAEKTFRWAFEHGNKILFLQCS